MVFTQSLAEIRRDFWIRPLEENVDTYKLVPLRISINHVTSESHIETILSHPWKLSISCGQFCNPICHNLIYILSALQQLKGYNSKQSRLMNFLSQEKRLIFYLLSNIFLLYLKKLLERKYFWEICFSVVSLIHLYIGLRKKLILSSCIVYVSFIVLEV